MYAYKVFVTTLIALFMAILAYVGISDKNTVRVFRVSVIIFILEMLSIVAIWG